MGYNTDFSGELTVSPPLNEYEQSYLEDFANLRHTSVDHELLDISAGPCARGNTPQGDKPGIWCHWVPDDADTLVWDGVEKTYAHNEWLIWLIEHLLTAKARPFVDAHLAEDPRLANFTCDHVLDGEVIALGEESGDLWKIEVDDNQVRVRSAHVAFDD